MSNMPPGYQPHSRRSPLTDPWEPLFSRQTGGAPSEASTYAPTDTLYLALEIHEAHCNARGFAHGGLISALADNAMGHSAVLQARRRAGAEKASAVTVSLSLDFIDSARVGDCVEFQPTVLKVGRTLAFVDCRVVCGERLIARGSASFRMV